MVERYAPCLEQQEVAQGVVFGCWRVRSARTARRAYALGSQPRRADRPSVAPHRRSVARQLLIDLEEDEQARLRLVAALRRGVGQ